MSTSSVNHLNDWLTKQLDRHLTSYNSTIRSALDQISPLLDSLDDPSVENLNTGLQTAEFLIPIQVDCDTLTTAIAASLINKLSLTQIKKITTLPKPIITMLISNKKCGQLNALHQHSHEGDTQWSNSRALLLAIVDDPRVLLVFLAQQLLHIKQLPDQANETEQHIAKLGLHVFAPLANRLGIGQLKWLIEDLSFRKTNPEAYFTISKSLKQKRTQRETFVTNFVEELNDIFIKEKKFSAMEISGRAKHIYGIHQKIQRKNSDFAHIFDTIAVRALFDNIDDCYLALGLIHQQWPHVPEEYDDYIANPKPNGYQSIHTVAITESGRHVEIQLRTHQMNDIAELGMAAHWVYKEAGSSNQVNTTEKINWLNNLLTWHEEVSQIESEKKQLYDSTFKQRIYVFTPNGKLLDLGQPATPLDFAYTVHTDVGHRCRGAKVNKKIVPLTHQLKTGDQIEIMTQKIPKPSRDWLNPDLGYLFSRHAKSKIRRWFKEENSEHYISDGLHIWEKQLKHEKFDKKTLDQLLKQLNFKKMADLYCAIGSKEIGTKTLIQKLRIITGTTNIIKTTPAHKQEDNTSSANTPILIEGLGGLTSYLAKCCEPLPGDNVIGYISKHHGIAVHQVTCKNILNINEEKKKKLVNVSWGGENLSIYPANLLIFCDDLDKTAQTIRNLLNHHKIKLHEIKQIKRNKNPHLHIRIDISGRQSLNRLIDQVNSNPLVQSIKQLR